MIFARGYAQEDMINFGISETNDDLSNAIKTCARNLSC